MQCKFNKVVSGTSKKGTVLVSVKSLSGQYFNAWLPTAAIGGKDGLSEGDVLEFEVTSVYNELTFRSPANALEFAKRLLAMIVNNNVSAREINNREPEGTGRLFWINSTIYYRKVVVNGELEFAPEASADDVRREAAEFAAKLMGDLPVEAPAKPHPGKVSVGQKRNTAKG
jgi:hypothetical protein